MMDMPDDASDHTTVEAAQRAAFRADVLAGLALENKAVPSRWLYDERGSELFEAITGQPEYYLTRAETAILEANAADIATFCGDDAIILEYGAGAGMKTEIVLEALSLPATYVPIDISGEFVTHSADRIDSRFPKIDVFAVVADFTADFGLAEIDGIDGPRCAFFPGSTLGNLTDAEARALLIRMRRQVGSGGKAILGIDLKKDIDTLLAAYDDAAGVTATFELNLLTRINRELDADFDPGRFTYEARWNGEESAVDMVLISRADQRVTVDRSPFDFAAGETIHTESSRKYDRAALEALAGATGWTVETVWTDADELFAVAALTAE